MRNLLTLKFDWENYNIGPTWPISLFKGYWSPALFVSFGHAFMKKKTGFSLAKNAEGLWGFSL